jgi:hypothetical protein
MHSSFASGPNTSPDIGFPNYGFTDFPQYLQAYDGTELQIRPRHLPSAPFPIHSLVIQRFEYTDKIWASEKQTNKAHKLTNQLTPRSRVLPEKLTVPQLVKKFPEFYATISFITARTRAWCLSLFWARLTKSTIPPYFLKNHFNIILAPMPRSFKWSFTLTFTLQTPKLITPSLNCKYTTNSKLSTRRQDSNYSPWNGSRFETEREQKHYRETLSGVLYRVKKVLCEDHGRPSVRLRHYQPINRLSDVREIQCWHLLQTVIQARAS